MIATDTRRLVGTIRTEHAVRDEAEGAGSPSRTDYRPAGTPLLNDGRFHYWMLPGEDYDIGHDGTGWRVTCRSWTGGHTYRLATQAWGFAAELPLETGEFALNPARRYVLRHGRHAWTLHEV